MQTLTRLIKASKLGNSTPQPPISPREQLYTEHFFLFLNDYIYIFFLRISFTIVLFLISIIPKSVLVLYMEKSSVFEVVNCCWTLCTHISGE